MITLERRMRVGHCSVENFNDTKAIHEHEFPKYLEEYKLIYQDQVDKGFITGDVLIAIDINNKGINIFLY